MKILNVIAGIVFFVAFVPYILAILGRDIWLRKVKPTKPSKATWLIWASVDTVTFVGMYFKDTVNGQIMGAVLGAWTVAGLALVYGTSGWTKLDKYCLLGAILGIAVMFVDPVIGIVTGCSVIFLGSFPTFVSAWMNPEYEDRLAWTLYWISCVFALIAVPQWTLADSAQPITFFVIESIMMFILFIRPRLKFAY